MKTKSPEDYSTRSLKRMYLRALRKSWRTQYDYYAQPKDKIRAQTWSHSIKLELERREWTC